MIEEGFVRLVQENAAVKAIAAAGGFNDELPKDQALPSWTYKIVSDNAHYTLRGEDALRAYRLQVDCYGTGRPDALRLAAAVDKVLSGFRGQLADSGRTFVQGCFRTNGLSFFDDARRTYRRMLEYMIWFEQN